MTKEEFDNLVDGDIVSYQKQHSLGYCIIKIKRPFIINQFGHPVIGILIGPKDIFSWENTDWSISCDGPTLSRYTKIQKRQHRIKLIDI